MITPNEAEALLKGTIPAPWSVHSYRSMHAGITNLFLEDDEGEVCRQTSSPEDLREDYATFELMAAAPDMAKQIANMRWEYAVQVQDWPDRWTLYKRTTRFAQITTEVPANGKWFDTIKQAQEHANTTKYPTRIVRRLVTEPEVIE